MKTSDARAVLKKNILLEKAIEQWGNLAALVSALYTNDYGLIGRSLVDVVVEPHRSALIPGFHDLKEACLFRLLILLHENHAEEIYILGEPSFSKI